MATSQVNVVRLNGWLFFWILLAAAGVCTYFLYYWEWNYSSDTVLVGMVARQVLEGSPVPIFVGGVGYQGLLVEVPLVAMLFRLLGESPWVLDLASALFYPLLLFLFFRVCRLTADVTTSLMAVLFLVLSPPQWYGVVLRSIPNYPETYILGLGVFLLLAPWLRQGTKLRAAGIGVLAGFGYYLYGQILFFWMAAGLLLVLLYLRAEVARVGSLWVALLPLGQNRRSVPRWLMLALIGVLVVLALSPWAPPKIGRSRLDFVNSLFAATVLFSMLHLASAVQLYGYRKYRKDLLGVALGFVLGVTPKLYYNWVLGLPSTQKILLGGSPADVLRRLGMLFTGFWGGYTSVLSPTGFGTLVSTVIGGLVVLWPIGAAICFCFRQSRECLGFVLGRTDSTGWTAISPLFLLTVVVVVALAMSPTLQDVSAARYGFVLFLPLSLAMATALVGLWRSKHGAVALLALGYVTVTVLNYRVVGADVQRVQGFRRIVSSLREAGMSVGIADYWHAHSLNFLDRNLRLEPSEGNYFKFFESQVKAASRIALVDGSGGDLFRVQALQRIDLGGQRYHVRSVSEVDGVRIAILDRE